MNFPESPGSAVFLALLYSVLGKPEFPRILRHFPGECSWGPQNAFSGEDEVDMLGSGDSYKNVKFWKPFFFPRPIAANLG